MVPNLIFLSACRFRPNILAALILFVLKLQIRGANGLTEGTSPAARRDFAFTVTQQGTVYVFGGVTSEGLTADDLYKFEPFKNKWQLMLNNRSSAPMARDFGFMWTAPDKNVYLYGGYSTLYNGKFRFLL